MAYEFKIRATHHSEVHTEYSRMKATLMIIDDPLNRREFFHMSTAAVCLPVVPTLAIAAEMIPEPVEPSIWDCSWDSRTQVTMTDKAMVKALANYEHDLTTLPSLYDILYPPIPTRSSNVKI